MAEGNNAEPTAPDPVNSSATPSLMTLFSGLCLAAALFFPRFLVALPIFGCVGLCVAACVRKERWRPAAVVIGVLALGLLVLSELPASALAAQVQVTYSVTGSASSVSLTMVNDQGGTEQTEAPTPWARTFTGHSGQFVSVSAQNKADYGTVTCEISVNGTVIKTSTSDAPYGIADCSGDAS